MQYWLICYQRHPSATLRLIHEGPDRDHKCAVATLQYSLGFCSKIGCLLLVGSCEGWKETVQRGCWRVKVEEGDLHTRGMLWVRYGAFQAGTRLHVVKLSTQWRCQTQPLLKVMPRLHTTADVHNWLQTLKAIQHARHGKQQS